MASSSTQVEAEENKQVEETIKDVPVTEEKVAALTDDYEEGEVIVHEEEEKLYEDEVESEIKEENGEAASNVVDDEEDEPDLAPTSDLGVEMKEFNQLED